MSVLKSLAGALSRERITLEERMERDREKLERKHQQWEHDQSIRDRYGKFKTATENGKHDYELLCREIDAACEYDLDQKSTAIVNAGFQNAGQTALSIARESKACKALSEISPELKKHLWHHCVVCHEKAERAFYEEHKMLLDSKPLPQPAEPPVPVSANLPEDHYVQRGPSKEVRAALGIYTEKHESLCGAMAETIDD